MWDFGQVDIPETHGMFIWWVNFGEMTVWHATSDELNRLGGLWLHRACVEYAYRIKFQSILIVNAFRFVCGSHAKVKGYICVYD